ncbi:MAG: hypothetical protein QUS09_05130 [Methanotrichaceae archaeon]|nr:hypothetical protein [Methanotrichaceae archaeon]
MARELDEKDRKILIKLVPELDDLLKQGIELEYMNILPPVANHHSRDERDFEERLKRLSAEEMRYLADLVLEGTESLGCLYPEYAEAFFTTAGKRLSSEVADQLREAYESGEASCG